MNRLQHTLAMLALLPTLAGAALAQTTFMGVEPNDTKAQATPAFGMVAGDELYVDIGCPPFYDPEIFRVRTAPLAPNIYRHRLVATTFPVGNYPSILGRSQFNGTIDPDSTVLVQEGVETTNPARFLQWYGFGTAEELYVDLDDTNDCRTTFQMTLETTPVAPVVVQGPSPWTSLPFITTSPTSPFSDVDLWVYDANFDALPEASTRRGFSGLPQVDGAFFEGTYFVGVSQGAFHNHHSARVEDDFDSDDVLDFRGAAVSGSRAVGNTVELLFGQVAVQATFTEPYQILWFRLDVGSQQNVMSFCPGDGSAGTCACATSASGQGAGCANSTGRGARLFAHGSLRWFDVRYELEDLPAGTTALLFASLSTATGTPVFGGNLCLGGTLLRVGTSTADPLGRARIVSGSPFFNAGYLAGTTVYAQAAYRDVAGANPCTANVTNGATVTVLP